MEELRQALHLNRQYLGERSLYDRQQLQQQLLQPTTSQMKQLSQTSSKQQQQATAAEKAETSRRILHLKQKQIALEDGIVTSTALALNQRLSDEDESNFELYGFLNDSINNTIADMRNIEVIFLSSYSPTTAATAELKKGIEENEDEEEEEDKPSKAATAVLSHAKHYDLDEFINIINAQPWLEQQAIADIRVEESLTTTTLQSQQQQEEKISLTKRREVF